VSQEISSACESVSWELIAGSTLWKMMLPTSRDPVHGKIVDGLMIPPASAASATMGLNVEPGG